MKNSKLFAAILLTFVLAISVLIGFLWVPAENVKTMYIVSKCIACAILLFHIVSCVLPNSRFSAKLPQTITVVGYQLVPLLARIKMGTIGAVIIIVVALMFFVFFYFLRGWSNAKFAEDEAKAKHSSNYKEN